MHAQRVVTAWLREHEQYGTAVVAIWWTTKPLETRSC